MANMTYLEALKWASLRIQSKKLDDSAANYLMLALNDMDQTHLLMAYREVMPDEALQRFQRAIDQYLVGTPPQYIVGTAPFYGRNFIVNDHVLIPRQETEELVEWVLAALPATPVRVLDVGTGSGAIGLTLKAERPDWQVTLTDISAGAVAVARENTDRLQLNVETHVGDLLQPVSGQSFDVIVSNPPYIDPQEITVMDDDVVKSEPHLALFADHAGLAIYEQLAQQLADHIVMTRHLFVEIGYHQGTAVKHLFESVLDPMSVDVHQDIAGHDRIVHVMLKEN
ncbi:peptide chain release factor N(5)-glutamine methyltransferase [Secundilactobacillus paracollinoides]|uniref:Release factor glutamine methyltransferase n=1 Tax=Secundilactobacillus paracollinoides TaxID=240427 RepID=A0A1B2J025_9LACO|nr:peptide chain release factor N(5)-glutamine methyltransferase [Secundilactobacillus paracollinoides]ANZ61672.1 hypothetical protein AYR61_10085 [Secundilactobacillus paracollinoides]ANZ67590.1 hypothetical protein AYR63_10830 [Secundilactobacillus paracollinoides]KRL76015.1 N5-glutamine S-adenosyl-L-methionine-dependent methyltransferase [Secundilactobacillus paracollinoides DSM 15502 = JCM 11969]